MSYRLLTVTATQDSQLILDRSESLCWPRLLQVHPTCGS